MSFNPYGNQETLDNLKLKLSSLQQPRTKFRNINNELKKDQVAMNMSAHQEELSKLQQKIDDLSIKQNDHAHDCDIDSKTPSNDFKIYVAIDFGTDGTGLAYCLPNGSVHIHTQWKTWDKKKKKRRRKKQNDDDDYDEASTKPKTAILLDHNGDFKAFGAEALRTYIMTKDTKSLMFERFKMNLYTKPHYVSSKIDSDEKENDSVINEYLTALNGKKYPSSKVFVEALKHLKREANQAFRKNKIKIASNEICWILTVPAIWNDVAKAKMREWAIEAEMCNPKIENQLLIKYEPDCASLSIMTEFKNLKMKSGEKYILLDAGGGTIDIACHEICDSFGVKELLHPSGGAWGDMYIDDFFVDVLCTMFDKEWFNEFKTQMPNSYLELLDAVRRAKLSFNHSKEWHNVLLPLEFIEFIEDKIEDEDIPNDIEKIIDKFVLNGKKHCFVLEDDALEISAQIWREELFDKLINPTIAHCKDLLSHKEMKDCKYLCIVGGFGCIAYFQKRSITAFGKKSKYKMSVIIPKKPILSVLDGAARMAMQKDYIQSRRLAHTYGIDTNNSLSRAIKDGCTQEWIQKHKYVHLRYKMEYVHLCFDIFAHRNQEIKLGEKIVHIIDRSSHEDARTGLPIYCTDLQNPAMINEDCKHLADIIFEWDNHNKDDMSIQVEFHFYDARIKVVAFSKKTPWNKKHIELEYKTKKNMWKCESCNLFNDQEATECIACYSKRSF